MKKTILLNCILFFACICSYSLESNAAGPSETGGPSGISTLVINANVTVVLTDYDNAELEISGRSSFADLVTFTRSGDTLVIGSSKNKDLKEAGVIYVPASRLRNIRINSAASVRSLQALQVPRLNVVVNGPCSFVIANIGELNVTGSNDYSVEHTTEMRQAPLGLYRNEARQKVF
ncbi:MAG: DUF2807 domain-containing protein [Chitinophagaceae bacterium]|nr:DUF2807 domain-containing protein [Chitinophagaceae bacterium]